MKKFFVVLFVLAAIVGSVIFVAGRGADDGNRDYLRIHVRANSNGVEDQRVKTEIKDEAVAFITPYICECATKEEAMRVMSGLTGEIAKLCDAALKRRGFYYGARAEIRREKFPTRVYGELTLEEGVYDALIVELGSGKGDNWWCVVYPPLCFTSSPAGVQYRSAIWEIVEKFLKK